MITRIVRLTFRLEEVENFLHIFKASKDKIRGFSGCSYLELMQDATQTNVFYTYSHWESPVHLEKYRASELFQSTWAKTKVLFADKPQAFSLQKFLTD